jgi:small-conductance mechanosensitive channel
MNAEVLMNLVVTGVVAIGMGLAGYVVSALIVRLVSPIARRFLEPGLANFVVSLVRVGVLLLTLKLILDQTGAAGVLVILITALTGAFALGSERIASDFVAGINLFFLRYYKVGDLVTIGTYQGRIQSISLTYTSMTTGARDKIIIPNSEVLNKTIVNHTGVPGARLKAKIQVEGEHDRDAMMGAMLEAAQTFEPQLSGEGDKPGVILDSIVMDGGIVRSTYVASVFVPEHNYGDDHKLLLHVSNVLTSKGLDPSQQPKAMQF